MFVNAGLISTSFRSRRTVIPVLLTLLSIAAGTAVTTILAQDELSNKSVPKINPTGYTSARVCGECHSDIYNSWKNSLHAFSLVDPIFDTAFMQSIKEGGEEARRKCLSCHAPMTMFNGDYYLSQEVSREGVSCDFCHTVTAVHLDSREKRFSAEPGLVKRGVIKKAASPAHKTAFSDLHSKSEFCGGCHNYLAKSGIDIMSTYQEWLDGPYSREGVQCQDCHMILSEGKVVIEGLNSRTDGIHLHSLIHDSNQKRSALRLEIARVDRRPGELEVEVRVENVGSGHMVPTGLPTREIVLEVVVETGTHSIQRERRYRKVVGDEKGQPLNADYAVLLYGAKILNDNRIAPREVRTERFRFPVRESEGVTVRAELSYLYSPFIVGAKTMDIKLGQVKRFVK